MMWVCKECVFEHVHLIIGVGLSILLNALYQFDHKIRALACRGKWIYAGVGSAIEVCHRLTRYVVCLDVCLVLIIFQIPRTSMYRAQSNCRVLCSG